MRASLATFLLVAAANGGEIRVVKPTADRAFAMIQSISTETELRMPEPKLEQEDQVLIYELKDLKPGKYRVSYIELDNPMGFDETLMVTRVTVTKNSRNTVYLFRSHNLESPKFTKKISDFLTNHPRNFLTLVALYDGSKKPIIQARGDSSFIHYLRDDCEYHLKVWEHSFEEFPEDPKLIYERKFRTTERELDPSVPAVDPEKKEPSEKGGSSDGGKAEK